MVKGRYGKRTRSSSLTDYVRARRKSHATVSSMARCPRTSSPITGG